MRHREGDIAWYSDNGQPCNVRVFTGVPGATVELVDMPDGTMEERNGVGSVVAVRYPPNLAKEMGL